MYSPIRHQECRPLRLVVLHDRSVFNIGVEDGRDGGPTSGPDRWISTYFPRCS